MQTTEDPNPDHELIQACVAFRASHRALAMFRGEEINDVLACWRDDLDHVAELPARTAEGRRLKAEAALQAVQWQRGDKNPAVDALVLSALMDAIEGYWPTS